MEVASPLTFQPAGTKRSFMCGSPPPMDVSDDYVVQQSKRRRFGDTSPLGFAPSFGASMHTSPFAARAPGGKSSSKQSRWFLLSDSFRPRVIVQTRDVEVQRFDLYDVMRRPENLFRTMTIAVVSLSYLPSFSCPCLTGLLFHRFRKEIQNRFWSG